MRAVDREFVDIYVLKPSCGRLGASCGCLGASWSRLGASWSNLGADLGRLGAVVGRSWGDLGAILGVLGTSSGGWSFQCNVGFIFPKKGPGVLFFHSHRRPGGILRRIRRIQRKRNMRCGTDPGFPTPGARMTVVYTNSFKLWAQAEIMGPSP